MNFFLFRKKHLEVGFGPGTLTTNPEYTRALDHSAMAPLHSETLQFSNLNANIDLIKAIHK